MTTDIDKLITAAEKEISQILAKLESDAVGSVMYNTGKVMNLQTLAEWAAEIGELTGGGVVELRAGCRQAFTVSVRWIQNGMDAQYDRVISMDEMNAIIEPLQPCVLESITSAVRKMIK